MPWGRGAPRPGGSLSASLCSEPAAVTGHGCGRRLAPALPSLPDRALFLPRLGLDGMKMQVRRGAAAVPQECGEGQGSRPAHHSRRAQGPVLREPKCPRAAGEGQRDPEPPGAASGGSPALQGVRRPGLCSRAGVLSGSPATRGCYGASGASKVSAPQRVCRVRPPGWGATLQGLVLSQPQRPWGQ